MCVYVIIPQTILRPLRCSSKFERYEKKEQLKESSKGNEMKANDYKREIEISL